MTDTGTAKQSESEQPQPSANDTRRAPAPEFRNPVVDERRVGWFGFLHRRPPVDLRVARVYVTSSGRIRRYPRYKQPTTGELLWGGARKVYDVDIGVHVTQFEAEPPSRGDKVAFHATIDLIWQVVDPTALVLAGIKDVQQAVSPFLLARLRAVTRDHEIDASEMAEKAVNEEFENATLGAEFGLSLRVFVRLTMDEPSLVHAAIQRKVEVYRDIIAGGDFNQFALQLALNPRDVHTVVQLLVGERDSHRQAVFDFVTRLLESDALDRWQIDDQVRTTLEWLRDSGYKVLTGTDEARSTSFGENHRFPSNGASRP